MLSPVMLLARFFFFFFPVMQESSKKEVLRVCAQMDEMMEEAKDEAANGNQGPSRRR